MKMPNLNWILTDQYFILENTDNLLPLSKDRSAGSFWEDPKLLCHSVMTLPLVLGSELKTGLSFHLSDNIYVYNWV